MTKSKSIYPANAIGMKKLIDQLRGDLETVTKANSEMAAKLSEKDELNNRLEDMTSALGSEIDKMRAVNGEHLDELARRFDKIKYLERQLEGEKANTKSHRTAANENWAEMRAYEAKADAYRDALELVTRAQKTEVPA